MKILLVNDDGYGAPGLMALYEKFSKQHEVLICAPDGQRSGFGHSVTLRSDIIAHKKPHGYAITGTPADCVKLGIRHLMKDCDLVVAGINPGANLGVDCNYSGTASAAREAAIQGRQALAASCFCREFRDVELLAEYTVRVAEKLMENPLPKGVFLNLNMPNLQRGQEMCVDVAPMGWFVYEDEFEQLPAQEGSEEIVFSPRYGKNTICQEGHLDHNLVRAGIATLTPVSWDATCFASFYTAQEIADKMKDAGNSLA